MNVLFTEIKNVLLSIIFLLNFYNLIMFFFKL